MSLFYHCSEKFKSQRSHLIHFKEGKVESDIFILISFFLFSVSTHSVALINHSCLPSVIVTFKGTSAEIRAVKNMKPGDEVSEGDSWGLGPVFCFCFFQAHVCMFGGGLCFLQVG